MKLLRVSTTDTNGFFDATFNQPIRVEPQSRIGLLSYSGQQTQPIYIANKSTGNSLCRLTSGDADDIVVRFNPANGTYAGGNSLDEEASAGRPAGLLRSISDSFNSQSFSQTVFTSVMGSELDVREDNGRVIFDYRTAPLSVLNDDFLEFDSSDMTYDPSAENPINFIPTITDITNPDLGYREFNAISSYPVSNGVGNIQAQLGFIELGGSGRAGYEKSGFIIGLTSTDMRGLTSGQFGKTDADFAMGFYRDTTTSSKIFVQIKQSDGSYTRTELATTQYVGVNDENNSQVAIAINGNRIQFLYTNSLKDDWSIGADAPLMDKDLLYPFMVYFDGSNFAQSRTPLMTINPFQHAGTILTNTTGTNITQNNFIPRKFKLEIARELALYLGFVRTSKFNSQGFFENEKDDTGALFQTHATSVYVVSTTEENYILELLSMNIDSYDSEQKQRKNIVSSLVSRTGNKISADATSSVLLDLLNTDAIDLRNIKMRLVDSDFNKIEIDGEQVATIIIAQKDESIGTL